MKSKVKMLFLVAMMTGSMQLISCSKDQAPAVAGVDETTAISEKNSATASANTSWIDACINAMPKESLTQAEIDALTTMREEELLAHDVYVQLYSLYKMPVFNNISQSETQHTLAVKALLVKYSLNDPAQDHVAGVFVNTNFQALYNTLIDQGAASLNVGLTVGATIEDLDIKDLHNHIATDIENQDILFVFGNLEKGSRNHLRSFYTLLKKRGVTYAPQFINMEYFNQIVTTQRETGSGPCTN